MLEIVPYEYEEIRKELREKAITEYGLTDAQFEGSNVSQMIDLIAYATLINNTNFTFGLNEMFISQASSRANVIKHAIQMGFNPKRKVSYQYKIKLKTKKAGELILPKYTNFTSNNNNYIYFGNTIVDTYGTYIEIKNLINENNNNELDLYKTIDENEFIINEEGNVAKVLKTDKEGVIKFLLEPLDFEVKEYSNIPKDIYVWDGTYSQDHRNFNKVGTIDTYLYDKDLNVLKVQITENPDIQFPLPISHTEEDKNIIDNGNGTYSLEDNTEYLIDTVTNLVINDEEYDLSNVTLTEDKRNIIIESDEDLSSYTADITYDYTIDNYGLLARRMFFSDLRGLNKDNEQPWTESFVNGWNGFYANDYNSETNVLYFPLGDAPQEFIDAGITSGRSYHNPYITNDIKVVLNTPFKRTRFSPTEEDSNYESGFKPFDDTKIFGSVIQTYKKDTLEIIVKEGIFIRYNELTDQSKTDIAYAEENGLPLPELVYKHPELSFNVNEDMVKEGYFTLQNNDIEDNGVEMFVTRTLGDGSIEYNKLWKKREYLIAEKNTYDNRTFVAICDEGYEDYINVYTAYAGTGIPLSNDMIIKLNLLETKGCKGYTNELMVISNNTEFEVIYFNEEAYIPHILHIEGSDNMDTEDIRENAPLFSNTANRAVTKNDYKTICEAQNFIETAQIWGGEEEIPNKKAGYIFFSVVPVSRSKEYIIDNLSYKLKSSNYNELFYPSYYQITGKNNYYDTPDKTDNTVLFNLLENYKIITLQLEYNKTIYLDYNIDVKVLNYKFGETIEETNSNIFNSLKKYFIKEIEKYNSTFYESSLVRYIDSELGDEYGLEVSIKNTISLYDKLYNTDEGMFINYTKKNLTVNDNGIVGANDTFKFILPLSYPIESIFEKNIIENNTIKYKGRLLTQNLTNCNTDNFLIDGDRLFIEFNEEDITSFNIDNELEEYPSNYSSIIKLKIFYTKNYSNFLEYNLKTNPDTDEPYTKEELISLDALAYNVGEYLIDNNFKEIKMELNTHLYNNINGYSRVESFDIGDNYYDEDGNKKHYRVFDLYKTMYYLKDDDGNYVVYDNKKAINLTGTSDNYTVELVPYTDKLEGILTNKGYMYVCTNLNREDFLENKILKINPINSNITTTKNVFSRLKEVSFII